MACLLWDILQYYPWPIAGGQRFVSNLRWVSEKLFQPYLIILSEEAEQDKSKDNPGYC